MEQKEACTKLYRVNEEGTRDTLIYRTTHCWAFCSDCADLNASLECDFEKFGTVFSFEGGQNAIRKTRKFDFCLQNEISMNALSHFEAVTRSVNNALNSASCKCLDSSSKAFFNYACFGPDYMDQAEHDYGDKERYKKKSRLPRD